MKKILLITLGLFACVSTLPTFAKEEASKGMIKIINNTGKTVTIDLEYYKKDKEPNVDSNLLAKGSSHEYAYKDDNGWPLMKISGEKFTTSFEGKEIKERGIYTLTK